MLWRLRHIIQKLNHSKVVRHLDTCGNGLPAGPTLFEDGLLGDVPVFASNYVT